MNYKNYQVLREEDKPAIADLWDQYAKAAKAEDAADTGWFKVMATTDDIDRDGESIALDGWDFANYDKNPVVLWAHDFSLMPIAKVAKRTQVDNGYIVEGPFAPSERGQEARRNYDAGFLNTMSVGFIPKEKKDNIITKAELLEISFVPVPANANAVAQRSIEEMCVKMFKKDGEPVEPPVEEPPASVEVDQPVEEAKGIVAVVADSVNDEATFKAKMGNYSQVSIIIGALWEVYMRSEVGVDEFDDLLKESIDLLSGILGSRASADGKVAKAMVLIDGKSMSCAIQNEMDAKAGRVLSSASSKKVNDAMDAMVAAIKSLQDLLETSEANEEKGLNENQTAEEDDVTAKDRDLELEALTKAVLIGIDKAVGKELRNLKRGE